MRYRLYRSGAALVALVVLGTGCAHYKLGAAPPESDGESPRTVAVATVGVPADWGVDGPRLTRRLVEELRARGLSGATWGGSEARGATVECAVDAPRPMAFGGTYSSRVVARCSLEAVEQSTSVRTTGFHSTAELAAESDLSGHRKTALEYAAADALSEAAARIAESLRH